MRKYVITILAVLIQLQFAAAAVVPQERAARYAAGLLGMRSLPVAEQGTSQHAPVRGTAQAPDYYIFNNPAGGWVILSADDRTMPVIAYSDEGSFRTEGMPDNMTAWMDDVSREISDARADDTAVPAVIRDAWDALGAVPNGTGTRKWYTTAKWDQLTPYNDKCPVARNEIKKAAAGCMATAMAIIVRFNEWPACGTGVIGNYVTESKPVRIDSRILDGNYYYYDRMPLTDGADSYWSNTEIDAVSQLIYDCGVMVKMDYTYSDGSAAVMEDAVAAFKNHLLYSDKASIQYRSSYKTDQWFSMIVNEIDAGRVLLYGGIGQKGGHAFVCDGYDLDGSKIHINWGWGGNNNGYYTLDLRVKDDEAYPYVQRAVIGLAPNTADVSYGSIASLRSEFGEDNLGYRYYGLKPVSADGQAVSADIVKGSKLSFSFGALANLNDQNLDHVFRISLMDSAGHVRQTGWQVSVQLEPYVLYCMRQTYPTELTVDPALTDYFQLFVSTDGGLSWEAVRPNYTYQPDAVGYCCGVTPDPVIIVPEHCHAGQEIDLKLTLGYIPYGNVRWSLNGTECSGSNVVLGAGQNVIRATLEFYDGSEATIWTTVNAD